MKIRKIAHVIRRFNTEKWGGTENMVFNLAQTLQSIGIKSSVFSTSMFSKPGLEKVGTIAIHRFKYVLPWLGLSDAQKDALRKKGGSPLSVDLYKALLNEPTLSLIHTHSLNRIGAIARAVAKKRNIPYIVTIHGGVYTTPKSELESMKNPTKRKFEWGKLFGAIWGSRKVFQDADAIICVEKKEADLFKLKHPNKTIIHLPNAIHVATFQSDTKGPSFKAEYNLQKSPYILCVSRIDPQKNQVLLIEAFALFIKQNPSYKLVLIGSVSVDAYHQTILQTVTRLNLQQSVIIIPGFPNGSELLVSAYKEADMFVLPSQHEPFGIVILEAWASGIPVIASKVGGIPEFTEHNKTALLTEPDNKNEMTTHMLSLAQNKLLRQSLVANATQEVKKYDWSVATTHIKEIYEKVIQKYAK